MNKLQVHPYLIARLRAVQDAFTRPAGMRPAFHPANVAAAPKRSNNWSEVVKEDDRDSEGAAGGGRGTIKGLREKDSRNAKNAMRKLTRR